ncbi:uncharacterized protein Z518_08424 [Rhinocladiella mackenziei CBS 650.93]|uniref:Xylanolytic transcriptional activator regulatory domain-containing protein n=1 Tax=Rhinocladiella mackenziei CBS 650.93 TaxID=1442369 RepID=A0A0D2GW83_9EURO|nr:uncharacterized protein Z518_08424 [Rhinocladiella mackenziei CBS 650.93]KIX02483.1 hypothetical protein Z518_08424 [Rhinocladiella mackenziei CBS 650.93]
MSFPLQPSSGIFQPFSKDLTFNTSVIFSYYRFLEMKELTRLPPEDVRYLEMKGCLHVPSGSYLDEFVRQYFLHVHPCLPILHEGDFWHMYAHKRDDSPRPPTMSLLLFQAMLFAASTFVPLTVMKSCGFESFYAAREILHQRARLLYDFRTELNFTAISQASLLLSLHCTPLDAHANTSWLSTAVQYAQADNAHHYYRLAGLSDHQRRQKKRLWWSCVLRDRILAVGTRRSIQITPDHFDFSQDVVTEQDFAGEMEQSQAYNLETKRSLVQIFNIQCKLAVAMTSTVMRIYPLNGVSIPVKPLKHDFLQAHSHIKQCKQELTRWAEMAKAPLASGTHNMTTPHRSVTLYADLTYIYYFTTKIALCNYAMSLLNEYRAIVKDFVWEQKAIKTELEQSIRTVTRKVMGVVTHGLAGHLPISAIAYTALPHVLLSLDVKLSSTESQVVKRKQRLCFYVEVMRQYGFRFDFVNAISTIFKKLLRQAEIPSQSTDSPTDRASSAINVRDFTPPFSHPKSWVDVLDRHPQIYFRLSFSLDYSLAKGQYPRDDDLPSWIIGPQDHGPPDAVDLLEPVETTKLREDVPTNMSLHTDERLGRSQLLREEESFSLPSYSLIPTWSEENLFLESEMFGLSQRPGVSAFEGLEAYSDVRSEEDANHVMPNSMQNMFASVPTDVMDCSTRASRVTGLSKEQD